MLSRLIGFIAPLKKVCNKLCVSRKVDLEKGNMKIHVTTACTFINIVKDDKLRRIAQYSAGEGGRSLEPCFLVRDYFPTEILWFPFPLSHSAKSQMPKSKFRL